MSKNEAWSFLDFIWLWDLIFQFVVLGFYIKLFQFEIKTEQRESLVIFILL